MEACLDAEPSDVYKMTLMRQVRFDGFRFDPETGRFRTRALHVRLRLKSAAVMAVLVAHRLRRMGLVPRAPDHRK
jgi:hypothetical protein